MTKPLPRSRSCPPLRAIAPPLRAIAPADRTSLEPGEPGVRPRCFLDLRHARGAGDGRPGSTDQPWPGSWPGLAAAGASN
ncbi:DUF6207 family protein [Streptomyces sp. DH-12]|uniref:DUF6207 family protein n=1 Tax=Streptomyces sp. DH-12 TaxID=2072509 RepID=UPI00237BC3CC|nr:DUF6207 family protein [Streptomyces sp. DH-12]